MSYLIAACVAFAGTHFLLSHPLRRPIVTRIGEGPFLGLYSLVAFATLGWMVWTYRAIADQAPLWPVGNTLWALATLLTWLAAILLAGSLSGNPALPDPTGAPRAVPTPRGVFAITRHPMMWSFALWALAHMLVFPQPAQLVLAFTILFLALAGAALQDAKKRRLQPDFWPRWQAATSYLPFAALAGGRGRIAGVWPGLVPIVAGTAVWLAASWAHWPLTGWQAGIWRWLGA